MCINWYKVFATSAMGEPGRIVVRDGARSISFAQLKEAEAVLAGKIAALVSASVRRPIAVYLPKCVETIVADTAIIHTGNAYMNMDVKTTAEKLDYYGKYFRKEL